MPASRRSSVDFPAPLGPTTPSTSPGATVTDTPARIAAAPCALWMSRAIRAPATHWSVRGRSIGAVTATDPAATRPEALAIETYGIDVIAEGDRKGRASQLFRPWFAANVSVLGLSYGSFAFGYGVSFWQALVIGVIGIVVSFALCGVIAIAGTRGSAPTTILSRASFGVRGNRLPALIGWLL